jgi:hypothetical protein
MLWKHDIPSGPDSEYVLEDQTELFYCTLFFPLSAVLGLTSKGAICCPNIFRRRIQESGSGNTMWSSTFATSSRVILSKWKFWHLYTEWLLIPYSDKVIDSSFDAEHRQMSERRGGNSPHAFQAPDGRNQNLRHFQLSENFFNGSKQHSESSLIPKILACSNKRDLSEESSAKKHIKMRTREPGTS